MVSNGIDFVESFTRTFADLEKFGEEYAAARALSWKLQEDRKSLLALLTLNAEGKTHSDRENKARTSDVYKTHIEGTVAAIHEELSLKTKYETAYAKYESYRSLCSLENARMKLTQ
jgi:hypothetical protein